jgi:hypothetical protein
MHQEKSGNPALQERLVDRTFVHPKYRARQKKFATARRQLHCAGTDVIIFKIFSPKKLATKLCFLTQNKDKF